MKRMLLGVAIALGIVYLGCAFVILEWNPLQWPEGARAVSVALSAFACFMAAMFSDIWVS